MNQEHYFQSEKFLLDQMSPEEKLQFEEALETNDELRQEFEIAKAIMGSAQLSAKTKMKIELEQLHQKHFGSDRSKPKLRIWRKPWFWAVVLITTVLIGYMANQLRVKKEIPPRVLYAQHFSPPEIELTYRGSSQEDILRQMQTSFDNNDYASFIDLANVQDSLISQTPKLQLALGIALMENGRSTDAREVFSGLENNPFYKDQVLWYTGLLFLKDQNMEGAQSYFEQLGSGNSEFKDQAREILGQY